MPRETVIVASPLGSLAIAAAGDAIVTLDWVDSEPDTTSAQSPLLTEAASQLTAYFAERGFPFDLPLAPAGTPVDRAVWDEMLKTPSGAVKTYGDVAKATDHPAQAVGAACGRNPIPIIIPCHRIVGAGGRMTGYSGKGGVETKQWLLRHEGALLL